MSRLSLLSVICLAFAVLIPAVAYVIDWFPSTDYLIRFNDVEAGLWPQIIVVAVIFLVMGLALAIADAVRKLSRSKSRG